MVGGTGAGDAGGRAGGGSASGGRAGGGSASGGSASGGSASGGSAPGGGGALPEACDCSIRDCRPASDVAHELCAYPASDELVTYTEREGCDYVELTFDYDRGWRSYYYDQGTLVAFALDNAYGGSVQCGVETSCTGGIVRACRVCRGSQFVDDSLPDCPDTLWQTPDENP